MKSIEPLALSSRASLKGPCYDFRFQQSVQTSRPFSSLKTKSRKNNLTLIMNKTILLLVVVATVGCAFGRPQHHHGHHGHQHGFGGAPGGGFGGASGGFPLGGGGFAGPQGGFGGANAAGIGNGAVIGNQAIGTGTGIANAGPDGFGIGLGVGGAVATPLGNLAFGQGESIAVGK